jgi:hypothetical protein
VFILKKHTSSTKNIPIVFQKNGKISIAWFSAEPPSQRASDETHFFNHQQNDNKKSLGRIFGAATPPGALICVSGEI